MKCRKRLTGTLLLIVTLTLAGQAQQPSPEVGLEDPDWVKELAPRKLVYAVPGMEQVKVRKNLSYKRVAGAELKTDVYSPADQRAGERRPAVIFIHGGRVPPNLRTTPKDWGAFISYGKLVAATGLIGITFNHRFHTWNSFDDSQADIDDLIAYVRSNAASFGVDRNRIVLWAVSAGGVFLSRTLRDVPPYIRCLVAFYPELDLQNQRQAAPASVKDETLREYSPVYHLSMNKRGLPPLFIARAGLDDPESNGGVDRFVQLALSKNLSVDLMNHAEGHHAFDVDDDNERSREIIKRALEFIKAHG